MSRQSTIKAILALDITCKKANLVEAVKSLQALAVEELKTIASTSQQRYAKNIEVSRIKRTINNSKQAIKKAWPMRHHKKEMIFKHIGIIKTTKEILKGVTHGH